MLSESEFLLQRSSKWTAPKCEFHFGFLASSAQFSQCHLNQKTSWQHEKTLRRGLIQLSNNLIQISGSQLLLARNGAAAEAI
jgi:hypothetical protein